MPIEKEWNGMNRAIIQGIVPDKGGAYELASIEGGRPIFIGSSDNLQSTLLLQLEQGRSEYFRFEAAKYFESHTLLERKHFALFERKFGHIPQRNIRDPRKLEVNHA